MDQTPVDVVDPSSIPSIPNTISSNIRLRPDSQCIGLLKMLPEDCVDGGAFSQFGDQLPQVDSVSFVGITHSIREGLLTRRKRDLLRGVSGEFRAGELTAIMGPSGAGKSTLMNILAGYTRNGVSGQLLVNDMRRDESAFRKSSCYIMQNDHLQPLLTVQEAMTIAANLKLSAQITPKEKQTKIKEILESISLWDNRKVKTEKLSGGQKKRLAIALELLKNPQVMFFDEPTSGLDSLTSKQCIMLLKQIASTGRTVICTIHQPSAMIFEMFDHLYALAGGNCIFHGAVKSLYLFLDECGLRCPSYHNLADYLLEVASGDYGDYNKILKDKSGNGENQHWREQIEQRNSHQYQSIDHIDKLMKNGRLTPVRVPSNSNFTNRTKDTATFLHCFQSTYPTSFCNQICVLIRRTFLINSRDRTLMYSRITTHLGIALFIGFLYFGIGLDASNMLNNFNFLFFSVMFLMLTAFNCVSTTFPSELPIIKREHFNKWYSLKSYYLAVTLADIPIQIFATLLYATITYFCTMQPVEPFRIFSFLFMCILISMVSQSFGLFIGAIMDIKNGVIFGPFCFLPFTIFSGFFVQLNDAHPYMQWLFHISFLKYGLEGLVLSVLGYDRGKLPCNDAIYCHFVYPRKFLDQMDMDNANYGVAVLFMIGLTCLIRIAAYFALSIQIRRGKS